LSHLSFRAAAATAAALLLSGSAGCGSKDEFAKVNGQVISHDEYMRALERAPVTLPGQPRAVPAGRLILEELIGNKIIAAEASRLGIAPKDGDVDKLLALQQRIMKERMPDKTFEEAMKEQGVTLEDYKRQLRDQLTYVSLHSQKLELKEEDFKREYETQKASLTLPERAQLRIIVVPTGSNEFKQVQLLLASKTDFAEAARQFNAPEYKGRAGLIQEALPYTAAPGQPSIPPAWLAKVKATAEGKLFGPVEAPGAMGQPKLSAWVKVEKKLPTFGLTYEDAKPLLRQSLVQRQLQDPKNKAIRDSLADLKRKAKFESSDPRHAEVWKALIKAADEAGSGQTPAPATTMVPPAGGG